jgi:hypothetical protein
MSKGSEEAFVYRRTRGMANKQMRRGSTSVAINHKETKTIGNTTSHPLGYGFIKKMSVTIFGKGEEKWKT